MKNLWFAIVEGIRFYFCIIPKGWWKRCPFLPLPSRPYIKFRLDTAYGQVDNGWTRPKFRKLITDIMMFLLWRRKFRMMKDAQNV